MWFLIKRAATDHSRKVHNFVCTLKIFGSLGVHNTMHNDWLKPVRIPISAMKWFDRFNRSWHALHCVRAKGVEFFQSAKNNPVLWFGFPPVAILIPNRFQRVISQKKDNKFLLKFIIYYFWVEVIPWELLSNEFTVQLLFWHTVLANYWLTIGKINIKTVLT